MNTTPKATHITNTHHTTYHQQTTYHIHITPHIHHTSPSNDSHSPINEYKSLGLELVVDEVIPEDVRVCDDIIVHISLDETKRGIVRFSGVSLTQQTMGLELRQSHFGSKLLVNEEIRVGQLELELLSMYSHLVSGGQGHRERTEGHLIPHTQCLSIHLHYRKALLGRASGNEGSMEVPIHHLLEGQLPHVGPRVRPAVAVRHSIDDGAFSLGEEDESGVDLSVLFTDDVIHSSIYPMYLIGLSAKANELGVPYDGGVGEEGGDGIGLDSGSGALIIVGDSQHSSEGDRPAGSEIASVRGGQSEYDGGIGGTVGSVGASGSHCDE
jgi:hypothetical protein